MTAAGATMTGATMTGGTMTGGTMTDGVTTTGGGSMTACRRTAAAGMSPAATAAGAAAAARRAAEAAVGTRVMSSRSAWVVRQLRTCVHVTGTPAASWTWGPLQANAARMRCSGWAGAATAEWL